MPELFKLFVFPALFAGLTAYLVTPLVTALAWKFGVIDDPKKHKHPKVIHTKPIPRGGGLALFIAAILFIPIDQHLIGILAGMSVLIILGLLDDKYNLNPYLRLGIQFLAAGIPIFAGIGIAFWNSPFGLLDLSHPQLTYDLLGQTRTIWIFSDLFALFWIVILMNFLNMGAKGVPGQLPGIVTIAAATIGLLSLTFSADITEWPVIILAAIVMGAYLGFLPFNTFPQRIMPSFSGSNLAGYLLAILSILSTTKVGTLMVVLAVPLLDTGYTIIRRILSGKSPVWGDRGHLHHRLMDKLHFSQLQVAYFYWGITAILGIMALYLNASFKLYTIVGVAAVLAGIILWLTRLK